MDHGLEPNTPLTSDGQDDKGRKRKREMTEREKILEKNRQSARDCRRRKKEKVQMLEQQVQDLTKQIHELQKANSAPTKSQLVVMRKQAIEGIAKILKEPEVNDIRKTTLQDLEFLNAKMQPLLLEVHKLFGDKVIEPVEDYFSRIEELLVPMDMTKFIMWGLDQPEQFYSDEKGDGIWELIVRELELSEQQIADLKKYRGVMGSLRSDFQVVVGQLHETSRQVMGWLTTMRTHLTELQMMLTPIQQAKFLWWAEQNMAVLKMMESMWRNTIPRAPEGAGQPPLGNPIQMPNTMPNTISPMPNSISPMQNTISPMPNTISPNLPPLSEQPPAPAPASYMESNFEFRDFDEVPTYGLSSSSSPQTLTSTHSSNSAPPDPTNGYIQQPLMEVPPDPSQQVNPNEFWG